MQHLRFQKELLFWYSVNKRDFPWRNTKDPYKILVSEVMAQQTQISRVLSSYLAFLKTFPSVNVLAQSSVSDVLHAWAGMGYNRRAVLLHRTAIAVVQKGRFPKTSKELVELPGIGPYTASAVASFAFDEKIGVVDTNVRRVLSRIFFGVENYDEKHVFALAQRLVPSGKSRIWNNAIMEFGALICSSVPQCTSCQFAEVCLSLKKGFPKGIPKTKQAKFEGSNRQARGLILKMLRDTSQHQLSLSYAIIQKKVKRKKLRELIEHMQRDGLLVLEKDVVRLP